MKARTIFDVAKYFLSLVDEGAGSFMTHLKLQKLCYYAQAWSLVLDGKPLFREQFEAWVHGPVSKPLWDRYNGHGSGVIPRPQGFNAKQVFTSDEIGTLDAVWEAYGCYDGKYLENLTHQEAPWVNARKGYRPEEKCNVVISHDAMAKFYRRLLEENGE